MDPQQIFEQLQHDLTATRGLTPQVVRYIADQYGYPEERLGEFFSEKYPTLEDYEVDLTFSYIFTPSEEDRQRYMPLLGSETLSAEQQAELLSKLEKAALQASFKTPMEETYQVPLNDVSTERYVGLLKLDQPLDAGLERRIQALFPQEAATLRMLGRSEVWQNERWARVFEAFLTSWSVQKNYNADKARFLSEFVKSSRPAGLEELGPKLENLIESCKRDMENTRGHGMVSQQLRDAYDESDLKRFADLQTFERYDAMQTVATELKADLEHIQIHQGEFVASLSQPV